jgi:hypothetical protein
MTPDAFVLLSLGNGLDMTLMLRLGFEPGSACERVSSILDEDTGIAITREMVASKLERIAALMPVHMDDGAPADVERIVSFLRKGAVLS